MTEPTCHPHSHVRNSIHKEGNTLITNTKMKKLTPILVQPKIIAYTKSRIDLLKIIFKITSQLLCSIQHLPWFLHKTMRPENKPSAWREFCLICIGKFIFQPSAELSFLPDPSFHSISCSYHIWIKSKINNLAFIKPQLQDMLHNSKSFH